MILRLILHRLRLIHQTDKELVFEADPGNRPAATLETSYDETTPAIRKHRIWIDGHGEIKEG